MAYRYAWVIIIWLTNVVSLKNYSFMVRPVLRPHIVEAAEVVTKANTEFTFPMVKTSKLGVCFNMNR